MVRLTSSWPAAKSSRAKPTTRRCLLWKRTSPISNPLTRFNYEFMWHGKMPFDMANGQWPTAQAQQIHIWTGHNHAAGRKGYMNTYTHIYTYVEWKCVRHKKKTYGCDSKSKYKRRVSKERAASVERVPLKL